MPHISRFALVTYSAQQMFDLVSDVSRYPEFLSWVRSATVHEHDTGHQLATLKVRIAGMARRFTTRNTLVPGQQLSMNLHHGPFEELAGVWRFRRLGEVSLDLSFAMPGSALLLPFRRGCERMVDGMVDDFCRRAEQIHGHREVALG